MVNAGSLIDPAEVSEICSENWFLCENCLRRLLIHGISAGYGNWRSTVNLDIISWSEIIWKESTQTSEILLTAQISGAHEFLIDSLYSNTAYSSEIFWGDNSRCF